MSPDSVLAKRLIAAPKFILSVVYFRSVSKGELVSWTIINTWIDESVMSQPTFFTTQADPAPPQPTAHVDEQTKKQ